MTLDLSTEAISTAFRSLSDSLSCEVCKAGLAKRVQEVVVKWSLLRVRRYSTTDALSNKFMLLVDYLNMPLSKYFIVALDLLPCTSVESILDILTSCTSYHIVTNVILSKKPGLIQIVYPPEDAQCTVCVRSDCASPTITILVSIHAITSFSNTSQAHRVGLILGSQRGAMPERKKRFHQSIRHSIPSGLSFGQRARRD